MAFADKIEELQSQFQSIDWGEIRGDNFGSWPYPVKAMACIVTLVAIIIAGYFLLIEDLEIQKERVVREEAQLKSDYKNKAYDAANLEVYRQQMKEMSESFEAMVSQLPSDTEVPGLLEDITSKGVSAGLTFESIQLESEQRKEYYIQLPISIEAEGSYHDMGAFASGVASLPRIVTLSDFSIEPTKESSGSTRLKFSVKAHTYRYNDQKPTSARKRKR